MSDERQVKPYCLSNTCFGQSLGRADSLTASRHCALEGRRYLLGTLIKLTGSLIGASRLLQTSNGIHADSYKSYKLREVKRALAVNFVTRSTVDVAKQCMYFEIRFTYANNT